MVSVMDAPGESLALATGRARARRSEKTVGVNPAVVTVAPHEVDGIAPDRLGLCHLDLSRREDRAAQHRESRATGCRLPAPLVVAQGARALLAEQVEAVHALVSVVPADVHLTLLATDRDLSGVRGCRVHRHAQDVRRRRDAGGIPRVAGAPHVRSLLGKRPEGGPRRASRIRALNSPDGTP